MPSHSQIQIKDNNIPTHHHIIIAEDVNARIEDYVLQGIEQRFHQSISNDNRDLSINFCA